MKLRATDCLPARHGCAVESWLPSTTTRVASPSTPAACKKHSGQSIRPIPKACKTALADGLFEPENTPAQQAALARLETLLALIEGWISNVVDEAANGRLASAGALGETVRRRRAAGGPAEQTFSTLVGLELRPRRVREAAELWRLLREARGVDGRDAIWEHPDLLPTVDDLDDPAGFVGRPDSDFDLRGLDDLPPHDSC